MLWFFLPPFAGAGEQLAECPNNYFQVGSCRFTSMAWQVAHANLLVRATCLFKLVEQFRVNHRFQSNPEGQERTQTRTGSSRFSAQTGESTETDIGRGSESSEADSDGSGSEVSMSAEKRNSRLGWKGVVPGLPAEPYLDEQVEDEIEIKKESLV